MRKRFQKNYPSNYTFSRGGEGANLKNRSLYTLHWKQSQEFKNVVFKYIYLKCSKLETEWIHD